MNFTIYSQIWSSGTSKSQTAPLKSKLPFNHRNLYGDRVQEAKDCVPLRAKPHLTRFRLPDSTVYYVLCCVVLCCVVLCCVVLCCVVLCCVHYTTLHYTTLHYTTLHYITLHYITLHYIVFNIFNFLSFLPRSKPNSTAT
jgi:hypothetical protein